MKPEMKTHCVDLYLYRDAPELHEVVLASEALAACAARDARIAELENDASYYAARNEELRAELSAIKAREPVALKTHGAWDGLDDLGELPDGTALYAAPVPEAKAQDFEPLVCDYCHSETQDPWHGSGMLNGAESRHIHACSQCRNLLPTAKAQGVVIPAELDRAFITGESCDGVYRVAIQSETLKEMQAVHSWLTRLNASPAAPAADAWIQVSERLPDSGSTVIAYYLNSYGKGRTTRAQHVEAWTIEAEDVADPDTDCVEYSEQDDCYYLLQGWYECIDNWDEYYRVAVTEGPITHWMPLPAAPIKIEANRHDQ